MNKLSNVCQHGIVVLFLMCSETWKYISQVAQIMFISYVISVESGVICLC